MRGRARRAGRLSCALRKFPKPDMPDPTTTDRESVRLAWARAASGHAGLDLHRASMDAGFRSYWRGAMVGDGPASVIVMDSPPDKEDVRPWLRIRD
jgi:aminoglycoside/choline kinase family phosphotransferase